MAEEKKDPKAEAVKPTVEIKKSGQPAKPVAAVAEDHPKMVEGKAVQLVTLEYKKDNHHWLTGVFSISKGINHVPVEIWEHCKGAPSIQALLKSGDLAVAETGKK